MWFHITPAASGRQAAPTIIFAKGAVFKAAAGAN